MANIIFGFYAANKNRRKAKLKGHVISEIPPNMKALITALLILFLGIACSLKIQQYEEKAIGYIGFKNHTLWAIRFNDCTEYNFQGAEKYLWFDRQLSSISCYSFKKEDTSTLRHHPISVYQSPTHNSDYKKITRFRELEISESGWGLFGAFAGWLIIFELPAEFSDTDIQDHCNHMPCRQFV